jgi:hypothetical protein
MFVAAKESGLSDKAAEAKVKSDKDYNEMKQNMGMAKLKVRLLQQHLRAFDKAHENASNRGLMLRKELDRLYFKSNATSEGDDTPTYEDKLNEVMKHGSEA